MKETLIEAAKYLRDEADFNRSWTDGRRGSDLPLSKDYIKRRLELAEQRDRWAAAIESALSKATHPTPPGTPQSRGTDDEIGVGN